MKLFLTLFILFNILGGSKAQKDINKPNVLFLIVDDLRPELGCYDNSNVISPNIDNIADQGLVFNNVYCQTAICMPSRVSVLSGLRPESTAMAGRITQKSVPAEVISLPQLFKNAGYSTISIGKVYHFNDDDSEAWTKRYTDTFYEGHLCHGYCSGYQLKSNTKPFANYFKSIKGEDSNLPRPSSIELSNTPDEKYPDGMIANRAIAELRKLKNENKPFFLAAGFYRPHLPFAIPERYWNLYKNVNIKTAPNPQPVVNGITNYDWNELRRYGDIPNHGNLSKGKAKEMIHGYYASITFTDTQIGKVMSEFKKLGLDKNTIVILWSDHGWNLGEHGWWCKHTNYEVSTRSTMIISTPDMKKSQFTDALVELIDIYPSLCELVNIKTPDYLEGTSFVPLMNEPERPWKTAIFSQFGNARTIRTESYRLIEHRNGQIELFDRVKDPSENNNVADQIEYLEIQNLLLNQLKAGWKEARPGIF
jgi:iduronate 2-sulfatase